MVDRAEELARTVLSRNLRVKKGETVLIESWPHSLPYARAFVEETRRLGAFPTVFYEDEAAWWDAVEAKQFGGFARLVPAEKAAVAEADVFIFFWGPEDRPRMWKLPDKVQEKVTGFNEEWYRVARKAHLRGCRMTIGQAGDPVARVYELDGSRWRDGLLSAGVADARTMKEKGERVARAVRTGSTLTIRHSNGTNLRVALDGVHARVDSGLLDADAMKRPYGMMTNNPSGQVLVAIDRAKAEGRIVGNRTIYVGEKRSDGADWTFSSGRLTEHSNGLGAAEFDKEFAKAPKGRDVLAYLSIGLNPSGRGIPPCEDTEEGVAIVGIGANGFAGGKVRIPFQEYAMVGEATIDVDGRTIAEGGRVL